MAEKVILVDDLDGSTKDVETVNFSLDGSHYQIDLNQGNATELRTMLAAYQAVARPARPYTAQPKKRTPASSTSRRTTKSAAGGPSDSEVRAWAKKQKGVKVNATGRIPGSVRDKYLAENTTE